MRLVEQDEAGYNFIETDTKKKPRKRRRRLKENTLDEPRDSFRHVSEYDLSPAIL